MLAEASRAERRIGGHEQVAFAKHLAVPLRARGLGDLKQKGLAGWLHAMAIMLGGSRQGPRCSGRRRGRRRRP